MVPPTDNRLRRPERIAVIGAGYIGLPTAAGFADLGYDVSCVDTNPENWLGLHLESSTFTNPICKISFSEGFVLVV